MTDLTIQERLRVHAKIDGSRICLRGPDLDAVADAMDIGERLTARRITTQWATEERKNGYDVGIRTYLIAVAIHTAITIIGNTLTSG